MEEEVEEEEERGGDDGERISSTTRSLPPIHLEDISAQIQSWLNSACQCVCVFMYLCVSVCVLGCINVCVCVYVGLPLCCNEINGSIMTHMYNPALFKTRLHAGLAFSFPPAFILKAAALIRPLYHNKRSTCVYLLMTMRADVVSRGLSSGQFRPFSIACSIERAT